MGFEIFGVEVRYYGIIIAVATIVAFFIGAALCKRLGYRDDVVFILWLIVVPMGIVFARIFYVIFYPGSISLFDFRGGGMAIYGAVLGGALGLFIYSRIKRAGYFTIADVVAVVLILAQAIGRWGNFTNAEAYGWEVSRHIFPFTVDIDGVPHLATFFYESMLNLIGFAFLLFVFFRQKKFGTTTATYLIYYGSVRAIIEPFRTDSMMLGSMQLNFFISLLIIVVGIAILLLNKKGLINQNNEGLKNVGNREK